MRCLRSGSIDLFSCNAWFWVFGCLVLVFRICLCFGTFGLGLWLGLACRFRWGLRWWVFLVMVLFCCFGLGCGVIRLVLGFGFGAGLGVGFVFG